MISLEHLNKSYGNTVLNNINYNFLEGNIYVLKGISGSGKTTLLNILSGLDSNYEGNYFYDSKDIKQLSNNEKKEFLLNFSYITQECLLISNMKIIDNLMFIKNDYEKILTLAEKFGVLEILDKTPKQISGGERQRIPLIRSLLYDSKVILADEPTSSLDHKNSLEFVKKINLLKSKNKIVIISTHKDIYDNIADKILTLEFGKIVENNVSYYKTDDSLIPSNNQNIEKQIIEKNKIDKYDMIYLKNKIKRKKNRIAQISLTFLIMIIILNFILTFHYRNIYIAVTAKQYPYHIISVPKNDYNNLKSYIKTQYDDYTVETDSYKAFSLLKKEDSNLNIPGIIKIGYFPKTENEILINDAFMSTFFPDIRDDSVKGKEIKVKNKIYKISGVVSNENQNNLYVYLANPYYSEIYDSATNHAKPAIFIPYSSISKIGIKENKEYVVVSVFKNNLIDLYSNSKYYDSSFLQAGTYSLWYNEINNKVDSVTYVSTVGVIIIIIVGILSMIFIGNQISLDLFYRKKEIGYLQIFHVKKNRIQKLLILEYLNSIIWSFFYSVIAFIVFNTVGSIVFHINFFQSWLTLFIVMIVIFIYSIVVIIIPTRKWLKKDILFLIKDN